MPVRTKPRSEEEVCLRQRVRAYLWPSLEEEFHSEQGQEFGGLSLPYCVLEGRMDHPLVGVVEGGGAGAEGGQPVELAEVGGPSAILQGGGRGTKVEDGGRADNFLKKLLSDKVTQSPVANTNFRAVVKDGGIERETRYHCNLCEKEFATVFSAKTHITRVHVNNKKGEKDNSSKKDEEKGKKRTLDNESPEKEDKRQRASSKGVDMAEVEKWSKKNISEKNVLDQIKETPQLEGVEEYEMTPEAPKNVSAEELERWNKEWREIVAEKDVIINEMKVNMSNNKEMLNIMNGEKASLEQTLLEKDEQLKTIEEDLVKYEGAFIHMKEKLELVENQDPSQKVKEARKELKDKKRELDEERKFKEEALRKLKTETNKRNKAEADMAAMKRHMDSMTKLAEEKAKKDDISRRNRRDHNADERRSPQKRRVENRKRSPLFSRRGGGRDDKRRSRSQETAMRRKRSISAEQEKKSRSKDRQRSRSKEPQKSRRKERQRSRSKGRRSRSQERSSRGKADCGFWLLGTCAFGNGCKKGVHDPKKEGQAKRQSRQDFHQALVGAPPGPGYASRGEMQGQPMMMMVPTNQLYGQQGLVAGQLFGQQNQVYSQQAQVYGQGMPGRSLGSR